MLIPLLVGMFAGCTLGVVAVSLAIMSKGDEQEQYEALKRIERQSKLTAAKS